MSDPDPSNVAGLVGLWDLRSRETSNDIKDIPGDLDEGRTGHV